MPLVQDPGWRTSALICSSQTVLIVAHKAGWPGRRLGRWGGVGKAEEWREQRHRRWKRSARKSAVRSSQEGEGWEGWRVRWKGERGLRCELATVELSFSCGPGPVLAAAGFSCHCTVVRGCTSYYLYPFKFIEIVLGPSIWSMPENDPRALEKKTHSWKGHG